MPEEELTHLDEAGHARMVDVGDKPVTRRRAVATAGVRMSPETARRLLDGDLPKGDALAVARLAGIQAAKRTPELIPLCHHVALAGVGVDLEVDAAQGLVAIRAAVEAADRTGVEMEALTAVSLACLTLYDMCKAVDKGMEIGAIHLETKTGGKSGDYRRDEARGARAMAPSVIEATPPPIVTGEGAAGEVSVGQRYDTAAPCIHVKCLAELRERLGVGDVSVPVDRLPSSDVAGLKTALKALDPRFEGLDQGRVLCAVNQVMAGDATPLTDNDEVAFFPPVTGG